MRQLSRRTPVLGGLATAGAISLPVAANSRASAASAAAAASPFPFTLGVASGEPAPDSVVLWTRLAPSPTNADGQGGMANADVVVDWQMSANEQFTSLVASGSVTARYADASLGPCGRRWRFAPGLPSTTTASAPRATSRRSAGPARPRPSTPSAGPADGVRVVRALRVRLLHRLPAHRRRPAGPRPAPGRLHLRGRRRRPVRCASDLGAEIVSLADYRRRHAQYKADPDLQAAHAMAPWLVVPDDHEVENNYANMVRADSSPALTAAQWTAGARPRTRRTTRTCRCAASAAPSGQQHPGCTARVRWGSAGRFHMLDTRQFRDDQACGDG